MRATERGFTLIEVVVAVAIVGLGMLAVFSAVNGTVRNVDYLRDRTFAAWIADNRITELRLADELPSVDETESDEDFAGRRWRWRATVSQTPVDGLRRIDVKVRRAEDAEDAWLVELAGFVGATAATTPPSPTLWNAGGRGGDADPPEGSTP